jgi:pentatricopeptide repeat protein
MCHRAQIKEALQVIMRMDNAGITPTTDTTYPIFKYIIEDAERLDTSCDHLEDLQQEVEVPFPVAAFNCIIQASISLGDLQRAIGLYNSFAEFKVKPNVDTYNLLLGGCVASAHRELGDKLLLDMKKARVLPDARTYERLVVLCLTQNNYEDAFFYLEEMKEQKMVPSLNIYESLIRKCVAMGDTRYKLAVEELQECGYRVDRSLQAFIDTGGQSELTPIADKNPSKGYRDGVNRYKRSQFIDSKI